MNSETDPFPHSRDSGFKDGVALLQLLEVISDESVGKFLMNPKMRVQQVENLDKALKFITAHDVKLVNIGAPEIADGNLKVTLGMIWSVILRFVIAGLSEEGLSAKEGLLLWCQRKTANHKDRINNAHGVQDFHVSFQDGMAFCALIHRHRPDLINFDELNPENKLENLNKAFEICAEHLDIPKLLDAEDIVNIPRPDERSIMTYVAAMYKVFSSLDNVEAAGKRLTKFVEFERQVQELVHDYERRTRALNDAVHDKVSELGSSPVGDDYQGVKSLIAAFREYKRVQKRKWIVEQADLAALFTNIQAKLKSMNRPSYVPPQGLAVSDVESNVETLGEAERSRRSALNTSLRNILEALRLAFAKPANEFFAHLQTAKSALANFTGELEDQLATANSKLQELQSLHSQLSVIDEAEKACDAANIEENDHTEHTHDDLLFEYEQVTKALNKAISALESQIATKANTGISAEQYAEFKASFDHFDDDKSGHLSRLEFKSCLSSLGVIAIDFEGNDKNFEAIFKRVAGNSEHVSLDQFVKYMTEISADATSPEQLLDSFKTIAAGRDYVFVNDLKVAQLPAELVDYLVATIPAYPGVEGALDYKAFVKRA
jgi:Ca2+-binding EF-hand superfamily protein